MRILTILILCLLLVGCKEYKATESLKKATVKKQNLKDYIDFEYDQVIAFATVDPMEYHETGAKDLDFNKFHDTISRKLSPAQIKKLNTILSGKENKNDDSPLHADCFYPRHNIAFLDKDKKVVNHILICFECNNIESSKPSLASMKNYEDFFNSLGLKVFYSPFEHADYYNSIKLSNNSKFK